MEISRGGHSRRVAQWSAEILLEMNIHGPKAELIKAVARVHDLGKIGIPDHILNKPGKLTPEEKTIMDSHAARGAELLARFPDFARGKEIVRHHHESWDGLGYPDCLQSWDIPFGSRLIAVADSFDAMTSDRPYRAGMSIRQASHILREGRDRQWDTATVDAFMRCIEGAQEVGATSDFAFASSRTFGWTPFEKPFSSQNVIAQTNLQTSEST